MAITNGRNLAELASLINSDGKISAEAFSAELAASIDPTMYDSASDVPFEDAVKGTQVFVPSEGLLIKLTDSDWYSIDGSTGAAAAAVRAFAFQGSVSGYVTGGWGPIDTIDKFPFATDGNATDVGNLTVATAKNTGQSSDVSGYTSGGYIPSGPPFSLNTIDKFPFASDGNATDVGDLTLARNIVAGQSSDVSGYTSGGWEVNFTNIIDKFPFAADGNATDVGDLTISRSNLSGQSSAEYGYSTAGYSPVVNTIDKFPFAADGNATDVGDISAPTRGTMGQSSTTNGYATGGEGPVTSNKIEKFPFASDANATDVGDLTLARSMGAGVSSTESGYSTARSSPSTNVIDKFSFAVDGNATDVGDLTTTGFYSQAGQQV